MQLFFELGAGDFKQSVFFLVCILVLPQGDDRVDELLPIRQARLVDVIQDRRLLLLEHLFLSCFHIELTLCRPMAHLTQLHVSLHLRHLLALLRDYQQTAA